MGCQQTVINRALELPPMFWPMPAGPVLAGAFHVWPRAIGRLMVGEERSPSCAPGARMRSADARIGKEISRRPGYGGRAIVLPPSPLRSYHGYIREGCWSMHDCCFSRTGRSSATSSGSKLARNRRRARVLHQVNLRPLKARAIFDAESAA